MRCVQNKWGAGTSCERPVNSDNKKILDAMLAERAKQDAKWAAPARAEAEPEPVPSRYTGTVPTKYTSAEPKRQSQAPSSSERDRYASFLQ
jgi:hypothetical protein